MATLTTKRFILRSITMDDIDDIYEYAKEENVGPNAGWKPHESREETIEIAKQIFIGQETVWAIVYKENPKVIGTVALIDDPKREYDRAKMIGYAISQNYWGRGIMTEVAKEVIEYGFEQLELDLISAYCYPFNLRSKRVIEKCGFQYEGTLKKAERVYNGEIYDNLCFALTKEEYTQKNKKVISK
jgi:acetyltransferase